MSTPELTSEQQSALQHNHGFVQGGSYVLMTVDMYREMMGVGTDAELAESLSAINAAMQEIEAGRSLTLEEAQQKLDSRYGVHD